MPEKETYWHKKETLFHSAENTWTGKTYLYPDAGEENQVPA